MPIQPDPRLFPLWPEDCGPDRFAPRHVDFPESEPDPDNPDEVKTSAVYTNQRGQSFPLTASAATRDKAALDEFCAAVRIWIEAVWATDELRRALGDSNDPPELETQPDEGDVVLTLEFHEIGESMRPAVVFALVDPDIDTIAKKERHRYRRPTAGEASLHVKKGKARLDGVTGGPYDVEAGDHSPSKAAGRYCMVIGLGKATYWLPKVWEQY
jgi:hypothetical protein